MSGALFVRKPVAVEAIQWDGTDEGAKAVCDWASERGFPYIRGHICSGPTGLSVDGWKMEPGDWATTIPSTPRKSLTILKDDIFRALNEEQAP